MTTLINHIYMIYLIIPQLGSLTQCNTQLRNNTAYIWASDAHPTDNLSDSRMDRSIPCTYEQPLYCPCNYSNYDSIVGKQMSPWTYPSQIVERDFPKHPPSSTVG